MNLPLTFLHIDTGSVFPHGNDKLYLLLPDKGIIKGIKSILLALGLLVTHPLIAQTPIDYDTNDNGLIEITNLNQLNAIRWDLNGDGDVSSGDAANYLLAFPSRDTNAATRMGCPSGTCTGYELMNDLDFDTDGSGSVDSNDDYPNWNPIGDFSNRYTATFRGNGHIISHLTISSATDFALLGLFGRTHESTTITGVGLVDVAITTSGNGVFVGALVGYYGGTIRASYATGTVAQTGTGRSTSYVGGLVGFSTAGTITASWAGVTVSAAGNNSRGGGLVGELQGGTLSASYATGRVTTNSRGGGLVGELQGGTLSASYATGRVTATGSNSAIGGLVGLSLSGGTVTNSYYDRETSGQSDTGKGEPKTTAELQTPTGYTGIYANWDVNVDGRPGNDNPWDFGQSNQYPTLRFSTQSQTGATADVDNSGWVTTRDALLMVRTYLPGVQGAGVTAAEQARAEAWRENGRAVGGDLNNDGEITEQDALIMYYAYQFRALLQNSAVLRQRLFNGLRGSGRRQMPDTDETYQELLRRALRLR